MPHQATFAQFDAYAIERAAGDGHAARKGETLAHAGHASSGDGASQVRGR
jgi:hypothetical protein